MGKAYKLSFTEILDKMKNYKEGMIIESQRGDRYKLERIGNKERKFTRVDGAKMRFMTYNNTRVNFRIVEENKEIDIQAIEEYKTKYTIERCIDAEVRDKINEIIRVVNKMQLDNKIKEK